MTPNPRQKSVGRTFGATALTCLLATVFAISCSSGGGGEEAAEPEPAAAAEPEPEADMGGAPRVWFISPEDGATVTSPVAFEFGSENINIEPKGEVHAGAGHHHIGVNTECLPAGEIIPEADPWVHFGDGSSVIEMQLPPGEHTLVLQLGDGEHRTLDEPGLCTVITVNVEEGGN